MPFHIDLDTGRSRELSLHVLHREGQPGGMRASLLHGNGFSSGTLVPLAEALPESWHFWLVDLPGHGKSDMPRYTDHPDWQDMANSVADSLERWADTRHQGPLVGIGHSFGGMMTLLAACEHPHMFSQLILLDPPLHTPLTMKAVNLLRASGLWRHIPLVRKSRRRRRHWSSTDAMRGSLAQRNLYRQWHPRALDAFVVTGSHELDDGSRRLACKPSWEASIFASTPDNLFQKIANLSVPTVIVSASDDSIFFARAGADIAARNNRLISRHDVVGSHCFPMEDPEGTARLIMTLLDARDGW